MILQIWEAQIVPTHHDHVATTTNKEVRSPLEEEEEEGTPIHAHIQVWSWPPYAAAHDDGTGLLCLPIPTLLQLAVSGILTLTLSSNLLFPALW